jgi:drug/metabolite transporter (DMT)-like permease
MLTALFVAARVVANPVANAFQKKLAERGANPVFIIAATHTLLTLAALPILAGAELAQLGPRFWINMGIAAMLAVAGNVILVYALRQSDLSVLGPVNAYKAVLSLGLGVLLLGEMPTALGTAGIFLVLAGSYFVIEQPPDRPHGYALVHFFRDRGIRLRLAALVLSATEAVFLKRAILDASPALTFVFWSILGLPVAAAAVVFLSRARRKSPSPPLPAGLLSTVLPSPTLTNLMLFAQQMPIYLWLALTTGLMQAATLFTFGQLQLGYSLALFQLSSLISVFLGYRYFAERNIRRRLIGSVIMVIGAVLLVSVGRDA